ncbi:MAG: hypothetical protein JSV14_14880 [Deltaproteobacteria bacterium]|nr:MAG: hypothetical protein JSV14_14880 [Deltaproteobacteria bacterium]
MDVKILRYNVFEKNTLCGFCTVAVDGLTIKDCTHHKKADQEWIGFPSKSYDSDGQTKWYSLVQFEDKADHWKFQEAAKEALARYFDQQKEEQSQETPF